MWAHYAMNHTGGVIGIDTELAGLEDQEENIVTCGNGSIIYTSIRPNLDEVELYYPSGFPSKRDKATIEKIFLHKSIHWSYEEEVRAVRQMTNDALSDYQDFEFPISSIKEIYFGARFSQNYLHGKNIDLQALFNLDFSLFYCELDQNKWEVSPRLYE
ncbi:hypothetical protein OH686_21770 [Pseudomonas sp. SO81]|nr:hypothetical protein OH686_21770 [Pseudomonas sp. SO81]